MWTVEPAEPGDAAAVADLWVALASDQRRHGSHLRAAANREPIRAAMARAAADDRLDVARDGGDIVGFVHYAVERGSLVQDLTRGVVNDLYVVPERRSEGIGTSLLDAAEATLRDRGADTVSVEALADNERAIRLYERRGYRPHRVEFEREVENDKRSRGDR
ncbi:GNAT family N-acetyltransferase [Haloplanus rallus]|jgi:ribosomal protein S18 acetylase RimI-like enzyme|uniref:GNAT family N-acetyltransferase n=1 Tax=Haloplanus rallus TaxID=1816183 RepID=A0A6B9FCU5_9EURY|nr:MULTISPECIES: GNAT family N-acetyltransferase [Haloplanus]QGX93609.1 GNAT family N-acetyltransferase [Haloplanus rallus]